MNPNPKTEHLQKWQPGQPSPNPTGRKPKFVTTFKKDGYTQSEVNDIILEMLSMSESELVTVTESKDATILETTIARALMNGAKKGSLYAMESLLNRSVGMPRITQDVSIENKEIIVTMNLS
ncbi:MAG: DUF5681 domain-containing protein [Bacteroidota bacterium]|jgi:hypothetical protein